MVVANVSPSTTNQIISEKNPVPVPVIGKINNPTGHNLVFNSDEATNSIDEKCNNFSKSSN